MDVRFFALLAGAILLLVAPLPPQNRGVTPAAGGQEAARGDGLQSAAPGTPAVPQATPGPSGAPARLSAGPILGLVCAFVASTIALGVAVGLRRRIDRIAGPPPDEEDD